jgi:hypothetical protein
MLVMVMVVMIVVMMVVMVGVMVMMVVVVMVMVMVLVMVMMVIMCHSHHYQCYYSASIILMARLMSLPCPAWAASGSLAPHGGASPEVASTQNHGLDW